MKKEAYLYDKLENKIVQCKVCNWYCKIAPGKRGICRVRENQDGVLYTLIYASVSSVAPDPVEKKPLFHFWPGSCVFSLGTVGCNFKCEFCQNWQISQSSPGEIWTEDISPEKSVEMTKSYGCYGIAWTYNEPTIWFEYTYDSAKLAKQNNLYTVYVTNGFMSKETIEMIAPYLDAANIDIKSPTQEFYRKVSKAKLDPVLESNKLMKKKGIHIECTNLIIPTLNDKEEEFKSVARFVRDELGKETPLHFTRFYPHYKMTHLPPTPVETIERAREIALKEGLYYVYIGNVPGHEGENTYCYNCKELLIQRAGFDILKYKVTEDKKCPKCGVPIHIIGKYIKHKEYFGIF